MLLKSSSPSNWFPALLNWPPTSIACGFRQRDLNNEQPDSLDDLETYAEHGHSSIAYLVLEAMGVRDEVSEYAASHTGVCSGLTTVLRGFAHHASQVCEGIDV
jgi:hypothetical protein